MHMLEIHHHQSTKWQHELVVDKGIIPVFLNTKCVKPQSVNQ